MTTAFHQPILAGLFDVATNDGNGRRGRLRICRAAANPNYPDLLFGDELPPNEKRPTGVTAGRETKFFSTKERT